MAKDEHAELLKLGATAWNSWRAEHDEAPNLSGASLRGLDLSGFDLSLIDLRDADLRGTKFCEANLFGAHLEGANLFKAVLDGANLAGAFLHGARFLNCAQLMTARNWQSATRDSDFSCGAPIPPIADRATKQAGQRFQSADVLRMFPSFVWKGELRTDVYEPINDSIRRALGEIGAPLADLKSGESWQSDQGLHELDQFRELVDCINEAAETVLGYLKIGRAGFKITGCWANLNAPGAGHQAHSHPNNYLSGVYYVRTHPDANTINFLDPRSQAGIIRPPVTALTAENTDQVVVKVQDGTLLIFPAWLRHSVDPNRSGRTRISLGFNIMFSAYGAMARPQWLPGRRPSI